MRKLALLALLGLLWGGSLWAQEYEQVNTTSPQTLTNKTLVSPVLTTPSLTNPTITGTIAGAPTITGPTLTNPTVTGTISGSATITSPTLSNPTMTGTVTGGTYSGASLSSPAITGTVTGGATYNTPILSKSTEAALPAAAAEGKLIWLDDGPQGLIGDFGTKLAHLFGYNWIADSYSDFNAALGAIGSTQATLVVGKSATVSSSVACPSTLTVAMLGQSQLSVSVGATLTINCPIIAPQRQVFTGSGAVIFGSAATSTVLAEWWPNTTFGFQAAINALSSGQTLSCTKNITGTGWNITNKSNITIRGRCTATLSGASSNAMVFELIGTVTNLEIAGMELIGEGNAAYNQEGIGNFSGQTITNSYFHDLIIHDVNIGLECNAGLGGSYTVCRIENNRIYNIIGTSSGQGYGIVTSRATAVSIIGNRVDGAQRHSIYHGLGQNGASLIADNIITNHRLGVGNGNRVGALVVVRSSGVTVTRNYIFKAYDGCLDISHDTSRAENASDILVEGNHCLDRQNATDDIYIGELVLPAGYSTQRITLRNNVIKNDYSRTGSASDTFIYNGRYITYENNSHHRTGITSTAYLIELGHNSAIGTSTDFDYVTVRNNTIRVEGTTLTSTTGFSIESDITTGTSHVKVTGNSFEGGVATPYSLTAASTNPNLLIDYGTGSVPGIYTAGDTTPSVDGIHVLSVANGSATTITHFDDGKEGQRILLRFADANTTIQHNVNIKLSGGSNFVSTANDTLSLMNVSGVWYEVGRSVNG